VRRSPTKREGLDRVHRCPSTSIDAHRRPSTPADTSCKVPAHTLVFALSPARFRMQFSEVCNARIHMRRSLIAKTWTIALAATSIAGAQTPRGAMLLRVADANDSSLAGAAIVLPTLDVTFAVPVGGSLLIRDVAPGTYIVQARRLGYAPQTKLLRVGTDTAQVHFNLAPTANELDTVRVTGIAGTWQADFLRRQRLGFGQYFTQADILAAHADRLTSLLRNARGLVVKPARDGAPDQINLVRSAGDCSSVAIYLDGVLVNGQAVVQTAMVTKQQPKTTPSARDPGNSQPTTSSANPPAQPPPNAKPTARAVYQAAQNGTAPVIDQRGPEVMGAFDPNTIPLSLLGGIEVYTNTATIPPEYKQRSNPCGVILLWTK
jgi:hypothetical protein